MKLVRPPRLRAGDSVMVVSPSAPLAGMLPARVARGLACLRTMGYRPVLGRHALEVSGYTAGTPKERASDIMEAFRRPDVRAIVAAIGGNHSNQTLPFLDFEFIRRHPKIFVGYSDVTVLHLALHARAGLVSFYGPALLPQFAENPSVLPYTRRCFERAVGSRAPVGRLEPSPRWTEEALDWFSGADAKRPRKLRRNPGWYWLRSGSARGRLIGGCLASMNHLRGTRYWPDFAGSILFLETSESEEDFRKGESLPTVDANLTDLALSGVFDAIRGLIVGRPYGYTPYQRRQFRDLLRLRLKGYRFPVVTNVDVGHTDPILTLPIGVRATLDSRSNTLRIDEAAVTGE